MEIHDLTKGKPLAEGYTYMYYVLSDATYFGKTKFHKTPDCPHLKNWKPAGHVKIRASGWKSPLVLYKSDYTIPNGPDNTLCKTCWRNK